MSVAPAPLHPDREQIELFISTLFRHATPESYIAFRAFAQKARGARRSILINSVRADALDLVDRAHASADHTANEQVPAAFYVPIATFKTTDTAKTRDLVDGLTISVECDEHPEPAVRELTAVLGPPTLVVASGGMWTDKLGIDWPKLHLHWRLGVPARTKEQLGLLAEARSLARQFVDSDPTCDPVVHPLRVAGGWHRKEGKHPSLVRITACNPDAEIDLDIALAALRNVVPEPKKDHRDGPTTPGNLKGETDDIAAALDVIPNRDLPWDSWLRILMAAWAASEGQAYEAAFRWSAKSEKDDPEATEAQWDHIGQHPPDRIGMGTLVREACRAKPGWTSPSLQRLREAETSKKHFDASPIGGNSATLMEDEAAVRFAEEYRGRLRYCHDHGSWFEWTETHWRRESTGLAFHWARELARKMARGENHQTQVTFGKAAFASSVERFARADRAFAVTADVWDRDPFLLGTPGGTVDLRTGRLRAANPADGITRVTAVAPASHVDCPLWLQFLDQATGGDAALIRFLQQWCGYALTGDTREHALVFVFGDGGNGKSVFVLVLTKILAAYATVAAMETFVASHSDRHSTDLAMLRGARLVTASETEEGRHWAEARIKALTGGDPITARFMRQDFFTFEPTFKLTIVGNHKPGLKSVDAAARRRFNLIPFTRKPAVPDLQLEEKLKAEWPGILRWMIEGCLDWKKNGLVRPPIVIEATDEYFADQDSFGLWLSERCIKGILAKATSAELFASWAAFARVNNEPAGTARGFAQVMQKHGFAQSNHVPTAMGSRVRGFIGVALRRDQAEAAE